MRLVWNVVLGIWNLRRVRRGAWYAPHVLVGALLVLGAYPARAQDPPEDPKGDHAAETQSGPARAQDSLGENLWNALRGETPHETAVGFYAGKAYDWSEMYFFLGSVQALFNYDAIWPHRAPAGLKIRFEGNAGTAVGTEFPGERLVLSGNFLAVYEFGAPATARLVPYLEAGVGGIYTDFQREDQGSRVNFNPVAGIGLRTKSFYVTLRAHHLSNANLNRHNRGINSIVLGFGVYLGAGR